MDIKFNPACSRDRDYVTAVVEMFDAEFSEGDAPATTPTTAPAAAPSTTHAPDAAAATTAPAETASPTLDSLGMPHNPEYHQSPPVQISDGSWKCKRGKKDELAAAVAAHKANAHAAAGAAMTTPTPQTAPAAAGGMPTGAPAAATGGMPMPGAPAPTTPTPPVTYEAVSSRFVEMMNTGRIGNYEAVYADLSIGYDDLATNQTSLVRLQKYMDALDQGADHGQAVNAGLS